MPDKAQEIGQGAALGVAGLELAGTAGVGGLSAGTGILAATGAVPIVGALVGIGVGIYELCKALGIGRGCGQSCIIGAEYEQAYEAAAQDFWQFTLHGLASRSQAIDTFQQLIAAGTDAIDSLPASQLKPDRKQKSIRNMVKTINQFIVAAQNAPGDVRYDGSRPEALQQTETGKWYSISVQKGHQLALALLEQGSPATSNLNTGVPGRYTARILESRGTASGFLASLGGPDCSVCKPVMWLAAGFLAAKFFKLI